MLEIAICDDNAKDRERIAEDLQAYAAAHGEYGIEFVVYTSAFEMLDSFEDTGCPDIALLDICMPHMLGTELAREILGHSETTDIIFLTTSSDYAVDAFSIHAADYIQKPYTREKFEASLDRVIALRQEAHFLFGLREKTGGENVRRPAAGLSGGQERHGYVWGVLCGQSQPCPLFFRHGSGYGHRRAHPCPPAAAGADQTGIF